MSLFGSVMDEDPIFGSASRMMRQMNTMMNGMMQDPFANDPFMMSPMMGLNVYQPPMMGITPRNQLALMNSNMNALNLMTNPMSMMNSMMTNMDQVHGESANQMFSSSSVMTMTTGPDGRPQIYQESMSSRGGPGGVRETQHSVIDSSKGMRKMAIGHHIGDRARIVEREKNAEGEEEREDLLNLDEEQAEDFEKEFTHRSGGSRSSHAITANAASGPLAIEDAPRHLSGRANRHTVANTASDASHYDRPHRQYNTGSSHHQYSTGPSHRQYNSSAWPTSYSGAHSGVREHRNRRRHSPYE